MTTSLMESTSTINQCLAGGGEMGVLMRAHNWSDTDLGPVSKWPQALRTAVSICLNSCFPMVLWWGKNLSMLYNDAYRPVLGRTKHPGWLGRPARECWAEVWDVIGPMLEGVLKTGKATWSEDLLLMMDRNIPREEVYFTFSYSPILLDDGTIGGIFCACTETTERVIRERRLRTLRELSARAAEAKWTWSACSAAIKTLAQDSADVPFSLLYIVDDEGNNAELIASNAINIDGVAAPKRLGLTESYFNSPWPLARIYRTGRGELLQNLSAKFGPLPGGPWAESSDSALVLPIAASGQERPAGFLIVGLSPRRVDDTEYRSFFDLVAGHIGMAIANTHAYEKERKRAEALAELDRAKTAFFSDVSHEFRTPLTLMLGPAEDAIGDTQHPLPPVQRERIEILRRNGVRLLKLVNTLLDFSRIEAGRMQAVYEPTDLSALTVELASVFRSAIERGGLSFVVDCPTLPVAMYVDRDMWEKIVLNLLSNAFKFTFDGEIEIALSYHGSNVELAVRDTGVGIPQSELPNLFKRFYRVRETAARTYEGSGIGLALVQELIGLHGGSIRVVSVQGSGTVFTVAIPCGCAHLPSDQIGVGRTLVSTGLATRPYMEEALRWLPADKEKSLQPAENLVPDIGDFYMPAWYAKPEARAHVLLVDDNADMRDYLIRLLARYWNVDAVSDGEAALRNARKHRPDLVLTDVMMPKRDGFGLLRALRSDAKLREVPIIMLSARADENARLEGLQAGADDYLIKPFSARELVARIASHLELTRVREESRANLRESEERFRMLADYAPVMIWMADIDKSCSYVNQGWRHFSGRTLQQELGNGWAENIHADDCQRCMEIYNTAFDARKEFEMECRFKRQDDQYRWIIVQGVPRFTPIGRFAGYVGSCVDITLHKQGEASVRQLAAIVECSDDAIMGNTLDGIITSWNAGAERIFGYTAEEAVGRHISLLMPPDRHAEELEIIGKFRRGERIIDFETVRVRKDQQLVDISLTVSPIKDASGAITGASKIARDITEQKRIREMLREASQRKDEFLAMLAHELRNPLAPIQNAVQVFALRAPAVPELQKACDMIERQVRHLTRLVDDLLDVSRITQGKVTLRKERVNLNETILAAIETCRQLIDGRGHHLDIHLPTPPVIVNGDAIRLAQIFGNLLNNAAKYTEENGRIAVTAKVEGSEVIVSVKDNGIGVPADILPSIFDLFTQADRSLDRSQGGLGIGLSLVKNLIELHGGSVEAHSAGSEKGSEFIVRLPAVSPEIVRVVAKPRERVQINSKHARILVVDDNDDSRESMTALLEIQGHEVRSASTGYAALEIAAEFSPSIVLLDIGLPGMDGFGVVGEMRKMAETKHAVILALTGYGQPEDHCRSMEAGFDYHLVKPVELDILKAIIESIDVPIAERESGNMARPAA
ncbi:MAG: ATP-binding protein [Pseudomonadota bacterium]